MSAQDIPGRTHCPRCKRRTIVRRDGLFRWRACPASKSCGWSVFTSTDAERMSA
jgi:transposase-like protein